MDIKALDRTCGGTAEDSYSLGAALERYLAEEALHHESLQKVAAAS